MVSNVEFVLNFIMGRGLRNYFELTMVLEFRNTCDNKPIAEWTGTL